MGTLVQQTNVSYQMMAHFHKFMGLNFVLGNINLNYFHSILSLSSIAECYGLLWVVGEREGGGCVKDGYGE